MIYVVLRSGSPAITAWIIDPYLLVYRQSQAAYYPQFIVRGRTRYHSGMYRPSLAVTAMVRQC